MEEERVEGGGEGGGAGQLGHGRKRRGRSGHEGWGRGHEWEEEEA